MAKEVAGLIKLQIKGGAANPSPPVGPALGSKGINIISSRGSCFGFQGYQYYGVLQAIQRQNPRQSRKSPSCDYHLLRR